MNNQEYTVIHKSEKEVHDFFNKINIENGSNYKIKVIEEFKNSDLLKLIFLMAYDRVNYLYGMSLNSLQPEELDGTHDIKHSLEDSLNRINEVIVTRELTGNAAIEAVNNLLKGSTKENARIIRNIIDRNLKLNTGTTSINKVHKNLIKKPVYMRCGVYSEKTAKHIKMPALVQLKADGTYREFTVTESGVSARSRSGESYEYPSIFEKMKNFPEGVYFGELTVSGTPEMLEVLKSSKDSGSDKMKGIIAEMQNHIDSGCYGILPREIGNGLINSSDVPHDSLVLELWDVVTLEDYKKAQEKDRKNMPNVPYSERFERLIEILEKAEDGIYPIDSHEVNTIQEALKITSGYMQAGLEGSVLKCKSGLFKDGTSNQQLKLKLVIQADVRVTGFTEGTGKNAEYFGAITFENDEGTVKGQVGVSSMTEKLRNEIHANRDAFIGSIIEVEFNDITRSRNSETWSFSHPRFICIRDDKDETDTIERIQEMKDMAMQLS